MAIALCIFLIALGIMHIIMGITTRVGEYVKSEAGRLFHKISISGAIWCFGYALMGIAQDDLTAYILRAIGMFGIISTSTLVVVYVHHISGLKYRYPRLMTGIFCVGSILSYILVSMPQAVVFVNTPYGRYYTSNRWFGRYVQYAYILFLFILWFYTCNVWRKNIWYKRDRHMMHLCFLSAFIVCIGAVFDTILPLFGYPGFPCSAITTFMAAYFLFRGLYQYNAVSLSSVNVSQYIFKNVSTPVIISDVMFNILDCNEAAARYMGTSKEELKKSNIMQWICPLSEKDLETLHSEIVNLSSDVNFEVKVQKTGSVSNAVVSILYDEYNEVLCFVCILNDKTRYEELEEEILRSHREAELANVSKHAFLKSMTVDITNPIQRIVDYCQEMRAYEAAPETIYLLSEMEETGLSLLSVVGDMLDISQMESGDFTIQKYKYDIRELLVEIVAAIAPRVDESKVNLVTQISPNIPRILIGDRKRMKQILVNLLDNAVKYTRNGVIMLQLDYRIRYSKVELQFKISDTGVGIREEDLELIFGSFNQVDRSAGENTVGNGLGLTIVRNVVKLMGGEISVKSALGRGTTFSISLNQNTEAEDYIVPYAQYREKVLLIEDDQISADALEILFRGMGVEYTVIIMHQDDELILPEGVRFTTVFGTAGLVNSLREHLISQLGDVKIIPIYTYKNFLRLSAEETGICLPLAFAQIGSLVE